MTTLAAIAVGILSGVTTASGTALLGVGSAVAVWVLRFAIRRRRSGVGDAAARGARPFEAEGDGPALVRRSGSAAADVAFRIPVPLGGRPPLVVRHAQLYAVELGLVAGGLLAWLASLAVVDPAFGVLFGAVMGVASFWRVRTMALPTVRRATLPWLGATVVGGAIGVVLFF